MPRGGPTRSELEDQFLAFVKRFGLPQPETNVIIAGREVDVWFPEEQLIVELDAWEFHSDRVSYEGDRDHDATALALGLPTVRITSERMTYTPEREAERLGRSCVPAARQRPRRFLLFSETRLPPWQHMQRLVRHKLVLGLVAILIAGSAGGAYAATQSGNNSEQALLNDVAKRLNVSTSQLRSAIQGALLDQLEAAVKAGRLTQAQANALGQRIKQGALAFGPFGLGHGVFRHHWRGPLGGPGLGQGFLRPAANYLGLTDAQLLSDLQGGKTLAQVAQARGKPLSGLEQALATAERARLDRLVAAGWLTKSQEQRRLSRMSARIARLVNRPLPAPPAFATPPAGEPPTGAPPAWHQPNGAPPPGAPPVGGSFEPTPGGGPPPPAA